MHKIVVTIPVKTPIRYPVIIGADLFDVDSWLPKGKFSRFVIITDHHVKKLFALRLHNTLKKAGHNSILLFFQAGEKNKNNITKQTIENGMLHNACDRNTLVLALGGGVVGDLSGFVAATYLRGIAYIQIPTTLLAMIDSSVGGKTAINTPYGKNLIGAIHQPIAVIADTKLLKTLPEKHKINGLIEAIKIFLTHDKKSFYFLATHHEREIDNIIARAVKIKASVVMRDEKEQGERALLNFGHTIGHALEKLSNYKLLHGYAVAYGILIESTLSHQMGLLSLKQLIIIKKLLSRFGIHTKNLRKYDINKIIQATKNDKKVQGKNVRYVLLKEIGKAHIIKNNYVHAVSDEMVRQTFKIIFSEPRALASGSDEERK